jgi:hypothetical protein
VRSPRSHCMILWVRLDLMSRADCHAIKLRVSAAGAIRNCTWPITMSNDLALQNAPIHRRPLDAVAEGGLQKNSARPGCALRDRKRCIRSELRHLHVNAKAEIPTR